MSWPYVIVGLGLVALAIGAIKLWDWVSAKVDAYFDGPGQ
jgi:hypothetical protein